MTAGNGGPDDDAPDDGGESQFESSTSLDASPLDSKFDASSTGTDVEADETTSQGLLERFVTAKEGPLMFVRETLSSVALVLLVGLLLFTVSGVWPPMVAVESGSMEPHMERGDLVFISEPGRYVPDATYGDTGVVTYRTGEEVEYRSFGDYGSVVVYDNPSRYGPPVIHRARFWVDEGENWYGEANPDYVAADSCAELLNCPAPHAGFVTKGDANSRYDQANGISEPVRPEWITGVAMVRIPYLGWVRLWLAGVAPVTPPVTVSPDYASAASPALPADTTTAAPGDPTPSATFDAERRCTGDPTAGTTPNSSSGTRSASSVA